MNILNIFKILIGIIFTLLTRSSVAMEEQIQNIVVYNNIYYQLSTPPENAKIGCLQDSVGVLFNKFFFQLIENYSPKEKKIYAGFNNNFEISQEEFEKSAGKEFLRMETQYRLGKLFLAKAVNQIGELVGAMFFYAENKGTEIIIKSFIINNIHDANLYQQIYYDMLLMIGNNFPDTRKIRILKRTVHKILKKTLKELGFKEANALEWVHEGNNHNEITVSEIEAVAPESAYEKSITWLKSLFPSW